MSGVSPSLHCPCEGRYCAPSFHYENPPDGETRFNLTGIVYRRRYDCCALCGHYFSNHEMDLSALYDGEYVDATYGGEKGMQAQLEKVLALPPDRSDNSGRVARILDFSRARFGTEERRYRLLDIGAGIGVFPAAMKKAGWEVVAVEPDARTAAHLQRVVGISAQVGELANMDPEVLGRFNAVTFNKVLEHVEDPVAVLKKSAEFVAKSGVVYVEVPDVAAAAGGPGREEFFIEHHHVFSPASLTMMAVRAGFSPVVIERIREPSKKFTLRGFLVIQ